MKQLSISIKPQYVKLTDEVEKINGKECYLHEVQKRVKLDFDNLPEFTIITAPTGTGKSYAFPFPALNAQKKKGFTGLSRLRGLVVLPTNALIDELTENFTNTYPSLRVNKITGAELTKFDVKGFKRYEKILDISDESDLVITNPDIINFAMHGGYHQNHYTKRTGRKEFVSFLERYQYIIFDEYHLYDEAQIANILTLIKLRDLLLQENNKIKFLFVSATPEKALKELLEEDNKVEEIVELITDIPENARAIHGKLEVTFCKSKLNEVIQQYLSDIQNEIEKGKRVLIILNQVRDVDTMIKYLETKFPNFKVIESSGYSPNNLENLKNADIIVATNKAEVGVNYDVEYCIMEPGKFYQNFIQRFGRISRGNLDGTIIVGGLDNVQFNKTQKYFKEKSQWAYYDFIDNMRKILQSRNFYKETIPNYLGEYLWCIENNILLNQDYHSSQYFCKRKSEEKILAGKTAQRYFLMNNINVKILRILGINEEYPKPFYHEKIKKRSLKATYLKKNPNSRAYEWGKWWDDYLKTYFRFRNSSKVVKIIDKNRNFEINYSLAWILENKEILDVEILEKENYTIETYTVGDLKERDKDIQYTVSTIPSAGIIGNNFIHNSEMPDLKKVFRKAINRIYEKNKIGTDLINKQQIELLEIIKELEYTFNRKRLTIIDINSNDSFL